MDRKTTNIAKGQVGYINFIVKPAFASIIKVFPALNFITETCENNKANWTNLFDEYEEQL